MCCLVHYVSVAERECVILVVLYVSNKSTSTDTKLFYWFSLKVHWWPRELLSASGPALCCHHFKDGCWFPQKAMHCVVSELHELKSVIPLPLMHCMNIKPLQQVIQSSSLPEHCWKLELSELLVGRAEIKARWAKARMQMITKVFMFRFVLFCLFV